MHRISINNRAIVSILMALSMIVLLLSGFVLFVAPHGRMARELGWAFLGMDRGEWFNLHIGFGFLVIPIVLFHLMNNWHALVSYFRRKGAFSATMGRKPKIKLEPVIALAIFALIFWISYMNYPPVSTLRGLPEAFRTQGGEPEKG